MRILLMTALLLGNAAAQVPKLGVASSDITPFLDQGLAGYYYPRMPEGVHDPLLAKALVFDDGRGQAVLVTCDTVSISRTVVEEARRRIQEQLGIPAERILISATHSHTGPEFTPEYEKMVAHRIADTVVTASRSKSPVRLWAATEQEPSLPHYRRYWMKNGTLVTNPGFLNPDIVKPAGEIDPRVAVLYAEDERGAPVTTWVNYAMHLDTTGGTWISADYAYFLGRALGKVKSADMLTMFTIGPAGNINHWDVSRPGPQRGLAEARRLGEVLASSVAKAYTHLQPVDLKLASASATLRLPLRQVTPDEVAAARKIVAVEPPRDVDFTLDRVAAVRTVSIADRNAAEMKAEVQAIALGPVAIVGIPGELFVELGRDIQRQSPFPNTFIVTLANDDIGYISTRAGYEQGGYEPTSSPLAPGAGERIVGQAVELLRRLR